MTIGNIRRFNDLNKRKLDLEDIILEIDWSEEPYSITRLRIENHVRENIINQGASLDSSVFLDVQNRWSHHRFNCGTVAEIGSDMFPTRDGSPELPVGVGMEAKFRITIVGNDKAFVRESPNLPFQGNLDDLVILKRDESLGQLPFEIDPPSIEDDQSLCVVRISSECWFELTNELKRDNSALMTVFYLGSVRASARSFHESVLSKDQPENAEVFQHWVTYFSGDLGVKLPDSEEEDKEVLKQWENDVVKSCANQMSAGTWIRKDLEGGSE